MLRNLAKQPRALASTIFLVIIGVAALGAPLFVRDPYTQDLFATLKPPLFENDAGETYLFGTDQLGRDLFARLLYGARVSLMIGGSAVLIAAAVGTSLGLLAGYYGGVVDTVITGVTETILTLPFIILAIAIIAALGSSPLVVVLTLGLTAWVSFAKLVRAKVFELKDENYVLAAPRLGKQQWSRHVSAHSAKRHAAHHRGRYPATRYPHFGRGRA